MKYLLPIFLLISLTGAGQNEGQNLYGVYSNYLVSGGKTYTIISRGLYNRVADSVAFNSTKDTAFIYHLAKYVPLFLTDTVTTRLPLYSTKNKSHRVIRKSSKGNSSMLIKFYFKDKRVFEFVSKNDFRIYSENPQDGVYQHGKKFTYDKTTVELVKSEGE